VPPTGAKGLNLAASDVKYLSDGLIAHYAGDDSGIDGYSDRALRRVWKAMRFSWSVTTMMHRFPDQSPYDQRMQQVELDMLATSTAARQVFAENYTGHDF
jgi:p-hydroxybenzoate 3-monooxygenase